MSGVPVTPVEYPDGFFVLHGECSEEFDEANLIVDLDVK